MSIYQQKADKGFHEGLSKERQERMMLFRAGDVIQKIFNIYQKSKWDWEFYKVERVKDTSYQLDDSPVEKCDSLYLYKAPPRSAMMGFLTPFPNTLFSNREEESALAYLSCHDSIMSMHKMVESTLQGICSTVEEVIVDPMNSRLKLILVNPDGGQDLRHVHHELFRVTTRNGEMYALDLTSAQYGYYEPIVPWDFYRSQRVAQVVKILSFGDTLKEATFDSCRDELYDQIISCPRPSLNSSLRNWQTRNDIALNRLLTLPELQYLRKRDELYAHVAADLHRLVPPAYKALLSRMSASGLESSLSGLANR